MKLKTIFEQLSFGEMSQIKLGGATLGEVAASDYHKLAIHVNLGLAALYKRFLLREGTLYLNLQSGQTSYTLDNAFAVSNLASTEPVKYIDDVWSPFTNDLMKVERLYDETPSVIAEYPYERDRELVLNVKGNPDSCFTPGYKTLAIPSTLTATRLKLAYRAGHPELTESDWQDPETAEVDLPYSHLEALLYFIASRVMNPTGFAGGNGFHEGNNYAAKFEAECQLLAAVNLQVDDYTQNTRLRDNGWV